MSNDNTIRTEMRKLNDLLVLASQDYYNNDSTLTDAEYDSLRARLVKLETEYPQLKLANSITDVVGATPIHTAKTSKHPTKMLSLDNVYDAAGIDKFLNNVRKLQPNAEIAVEPKYDGVAIRLTYSGGKFVEAVLRGDGVEGEIIPYAERILNYVPTNFETSKLIDEDFYAEVVIDRDILEKLNKVRCEIGLTPFKTARSYVSGYLRSKEANIEFKPDVVIHGVSVRGMDNDLGSRDYILTLPAHGFRISSSVTLEEMESTTGSDVLKHPVIDEILYNFPYATDGLVFKVVDYRLRQELGVTNRVPKWATAYKFPANESITVLREIKYQVSRSGTITPVGVFDPVVLGGVTITKANLCNIDEMDRLGVGVGDTITVARQAEVIPKITRVVQSANNRAEFITLCPSCGEHLFFERVDVKCYNTKCKGILVQRLCYFTSRKGMWISGLGESILQKLVDKDLIDLDLFTIYQPQFADKLRVIGLSTKVIAKLMRAIENSKKRSIESFIVALGLPDVGPKVARILTVQYLNDRYLAHHMTASDMQALADEVQLALARYIYAQTRGKKFKDSSRLEGIDIDLDSKESLAEVLAKYQK